MSLSRTDGPNDDTAELVPIAKIAEVDKPEEIHGPPPPEVHVDPKTGRLPFGWEFADD